nr:hypothetical protein [Mycobacterium malmoense]
MRLAAITGRMWRTVVGRPHLGRLPTRFPAVGHLAEARRRFGGRSAHRDGGRLR